MNRSVFSRIELVFWNFAIQTLSRPGVVQTFLREAIRLVRSSEASVWGILLGISAVVGLVSGYLFYFFVVSLR